MHAWKFCNEDLGHLQALGLVHSKLLLQKKPWEAEERREQLSDKFHTDA